jgi:hypothetical protein
VSLKDLLRQLGEAIAESPCYVGGGETWCGQCAATLRDEFDEDEPLQVRTCRKCKELVHIGCMVKHPCDR